METPIQKKVNEEVNLLAEALKRNLTGIAFGRAKEMIRRSMTHLADDVARICLPTSEGEEDITGEMELKGNEERD